MNLHACLLKILSFLVGPLPVSNIWTCTADRWCCPKDGPVLSRNQNPLCCEGWKKWVLCSHESGEASNVVVWSDGFCFAVSRGDKIDEQVVIGTPGKVIDWIMKFKCFDTHKIRVFVLDEADVMIAMQGHQDQSVRIHKSVGPLNGFPSGFCLKSDWDPSLVFADNCLQTARWCSSLPLTTRTWWTLPRPSSRTQWRSVCDETKRAWITSSNIMWNAETRIPSTKPSPTSMEPFPLAKPSSSVMWAANFVLYFPLYSFHEKVGLSGILLDGCQKECIKVFVLVEVSFWWMNHWGAAYTYERMNHNWSRILPNKNSIKQIRC